MFLLGPGFCAGIGNGLLLGYLMFKSRLVPPPMALLGLVGGALASWLRRRPLRPLRSAVPPQLLLTLPEIIWEASFGIYLVAKAFKSSPILRETGERVTATPATAVA
jgi:hypothetical protein